MHIPSLGQISSFFKYRSTRYLVGRIDDRGDLDVQCDHWSKRLPVRLQYEKVGCTMIRKFSFRGTALICCLGIAASLGAVAVDSDPAEAGCLTVKKWYSTPGKYGIDNRYVKVKNSCSSSKSFKIDIKHRPDKGPNTVSGKKTTNFHYANTNTPQGRGIYEV